jgi:putative hemolysin
MFKFNITILLFILNTLTAYGQNPQLKDNFVPSNSPAVESTVKSTSTTVKENVVKAESKKGTDKKNDSKSDDKSKKQKVVEIKKPTLKKGEYAIFLDEKYEIFTTVIHNKLEIESKCVKKNGVYDCLAAKSDSLPKVKTVEVGFGNYHPAANYCNEIDGKNLIAIDHNHSEVSFCRFSDGSMVDSWSLHHKLFPIKVIK